MTCFVAKLHYSSSGPPLTYKSTADALFRPRLHIAGAASIPGLLRWWNIPRRLWSRQQVGAGQVRFQLQLRGSANVDRDKFRLLAGGGGVRFLMSDSVVVLFWVRSGALLGHCRSHRQSPGIAVCGVHLLGGVEVREQVSVQGQFAGDDVRGDIVWRNGRMELADIRKQARERIYHVSSSSSLSTSAASASWATTPPWTSNKGLLVILPLVIVRVAMRVANCPNDQMNCITLLSISEFQGHYMNNVKIS